MSWIDIVWPMMAAAGLTLGAIHLQIWVRQVSRYERLAFFALALSVAGYAAGEWMLIRARDPNQYAEVLRWLQVAVFTGELAIATFVRLRLGSGRAWLFWSFCAARCAGLLLNFMYGANLNFLEVYALRTLPFWGGETVSIPVGVVNPLQALDEFINVLLALFLADATWSAWRRGDAHARRSALTVGGAFLLFFVLAAGHAALLFRGVVEFPGVVTPAFLAVALVIAYEIGRDVSRTLELSERLRASEQRMDLAADAANLALWEWNLVSDDIWATDRGRAMCGFAAEERISFDRFLERVHPEDREAIRGAVAESIRNGVDYEREYRLVLPGNVIRWVGARGRVEPGADGRAKLMRGVLLDIGARKLAEARAQQLERETTRHRNELAHLSRVATLGELSGALAHELNQPLAAILSNSQAAQRLLARDPTQIEKLREILADIVKSDRRAGDVIRRMRALLKKEEETPQLPLDLNDVVEEALGIIRGDLLLRGVRCVAQLGSALPRVAGDRVQLEQVLLNLIVNGCDAMENVEGERELVVRTEQIEGSIRIAVVDRGSGIAPGDLERIFEPFVTTKPSGMGLGLAVCRTIVQAHGGRLWAENNAGGGATVYFTLPVGKLAQ